MANLALTGRVGLVVEGTEGIGRAIAEKVASHGASVIVLSDSDAQSARAVAEELHETHGSDCLGLSCDPESPGEIQTVYRQIRSAFGRLDFLVNGVGVLEDGRLGMISAETVNRALAINTVGPIHHMQGATRLMSRTGGGSIANFSSIIGRFGNTSQVVYGASKAAVVGMTLSAAKELAPAGIRVNAVAPGFIETDITPALTPENVENLVSSIGLGRIGSTEDVADVVLFLVSDLSSYVTGQVIGVDGGMLI